ncbi:Fic family protein [bacterium]|nr:Fic family protein [bacterium]
MNLLTLTKKKERLDEYRPLPQALVNNLDDWFSVELTFTSNAIEGNTLTRQETALVVQRGITVGGKSIVEHLEATNHASALKWVMEAMNRMPARIEESDILHIHELILKGIDDGNAGRYRDLPVRIAGSSVVLPNYRKVPELMNEFALWLKKATKMHPAELAAEAHYRLVTIHPFADGNGRAARLLMNMILLMSGYPSAIVRKRDRLAYLKSLETAQLGGPKDEYYRLITSAVNRSLNIYLKAASGDQPGPAETDELIKIGELAKRVNVANSTIRHWTKQGLLVVAETTESGYQLYGVEMIERVKLIQSLKAERRTLHEIRDHISKLIEQ